MLTQSEALPESTLRPGGRRRSAEKSEARRLQCGMNEIKPGRYRHFKGNEYEVIGLARHSESLEPMVVYRALYGEGGLWVRPAQMFGSTVEHGGATLRRFEYIGE